MKLEVVSRKEEFTLIELLVVVAIIAILAGVLLPALLNAKKTARLSQCSGNLRQIGMLVAQYTDENNFFYPMAYCATDRVPVWSGKLVETGALKSLDLFTCPSVLPSNLNVGFAAKNSTVQQKVESTAMCYVSYGANRYGTFSTKSEIDSGFLKLVKSTNIPTNMMLALDFESPAQPGDGWYLASHIDFSDGGGAATSPWLLERHGGKFNMVHVDGHVAPTNLRGLQCANGTEALNNPPWYYTKYSRR